jgi:hypothetical protein
VYRADPPTPWSSTQYHQLGTNAIDVPALEISARGRSRDQPCDILFARIGDYGPLATHCFREFNVGREMVSEILSSTFHLSTLEDLQVQRDERLDGRRVTGFESCVKREAVPTTAAESEGVTTERTPGLWRAAKELPGVRRTAKAKRNRRLEGMVSLSRKW